MVIYHRPKYSARRPTFRDLHSTMDKSQLSGISNGQTVQTFTFHYGYISTGDHRSRRLGANKFTFHYGYISSYGRCNYSS